MNYELVTEIISIVTLAILWTYFVQTLINRK